MYDFQTRICPKCFDDHGESVSCEERSLANPLVFVPTKTQIALKLLALSELLDSAETVGEVADELDDEIGQIGCDIANRINEEQKSCN